MSDITFGYIPCTETPDGNGMHRLWNEVIAEAKQAEQHGFDAFQPSEHHQQETGYWPSLLTVLAGVAAETETIELGTSLFLLPLYHPVQVAEKVAMVDIVSDGRMREFTAGAGYAADDFEAFDIPLVNRPSLMEEGLTLVPRLLSESEVHHFGKRFTVRGVSVRPTPLQDPRPPVYAGAWTDDGCKRAARLADGWHTDVLNTRETLEHWAKLYRETCADLGTDSRVSMMREAWVGPTREDAESTWGDAVMAPHRYYYSQGGYSEEADPWLAEINDAEKLSFDRLKEDRFIVGSPEDCIEQIERCHETLGATHFALRFRYAEGPSHEETMDAIQLFGEEVIPYFEE
jgi:alkanesulfonate monooxygenase SsuD/methylene tetrahydromethanopterin reductase-like flavin-dependent oxidoreductase (luciferase family)